MPNQPLPNPWDTAMNPPEQLSEWFGQITVNPWFCALVKGVGRVAWDPNQVDPNTGNTPRRYTAIDIELALLYEKNAIENIKRIVLAEFGEWPDIVLPSLKDCGATNLQDLNGRWVRVEMAPTGRTYTDKNNGQTKDATTFRFMQVFVDEAMCRTAWKANRGDQAQPATSTLPWENTQPANGNGNGNKERETALKFLKPYVTNAWKQANGDLDKARSVLAQLIAGQALLAKYFTVDSQEVLDELTTVATAIPA